MYIFTDALGTCVIYLFFGGESDAIRELFFFLSFFFSIISLSRGLEGLLI